ncbi:MAG: tRNA guanosine(34) transglycosylase Tgt [Myxococcales bacterium]|nr:tRNA guanosine(34) transglycosylase Tgt [Myxococcales bacterium]
MSTTAPDPREERFERIPFTVTDRCGEARCGRMKLAHGEVETPIFMPVGTAGTVKGLTPEALKDADVEIILGNTYHLFLRPGLDVLEMHGGLHEMMHWDRPILTDSGGYQVFSLKELRTIREEGVEFRNHIDGRKHLFTPESVIATQEVIGSDIMMAFDECPPLGEEAVDRRYLERSMARTTRWAKRCLSARTRPDCALFAITQGGTELDLRQRHLEELLPLPFDGYAIGGLSVGEAKPRMYETVEAIAPQLPEDRPRYLMGVGTPEDLVECVARGVDMFDCVLPTRNGRNGQLFTSRGRMIIKHARYRTDMGPVDPECDCPTCTHYTRAYLRHLFISREMLAGHLVTLHNIHYYLNLIGGLRAAIRAGTLDAFIARCKEGWSHSERGA